MRPPSDERRMRLRNVTPLIVTGSKMPGFFSTGPPSRDTASSLDSSLACLPVPNYPHAGGAMGNQVEQRRKLANFGRNLNWQSRWYRPRNDDDVLEILEKHRTERVRAIGALHSWSDVAQSDGVTLDMSEFADVRPYGKKVQVGAGCTLDKLLARLHALTNRTLPTMGAIKRQTISGIISTGTHGSGKPSLSHFVTAVRLAAYDTAGNPK